jgi:hypothetical protein
LGVIWFLECIGRPRGRDRHPGRAGPAGSARAGTQHPDHQPEGHEGEERDRGLHAEVGDGEADPERDRGAVAEERQHLAAQATSTEGATKASVAEKAMAKKSAVSTAPATRLEASGARHQRPARSRSKIATSISCAVRKGDARAERDAGGDERAERALDLGADEAADEADGEAREHHEAGLGGPVEPVGQVGDEKGDRIGEGAPGQPLAEENCTRMFEASTTTAIARMPRIRPCVGWSDVRAVMGAPIGAMRQAASGEHAERPVGRRTFLPARWRGPATARQERMPA